MNKKGVTLSSLTIYVIVATVVIGVLAFLNAQFFSNINELTQESNIASKDLNFKSAFIRDIKSDVIVTDYSSNRINLSNGVSYEVRKLDTDKEGYAVFRNDVKIADSIQYYSADIPFFTYDSENGVVKTNWR